MEDLILKKTGGAQRSKRFDTTKKVGDISPNINNLNNLDARIKIFYWNNELINLSPFYVRPIR